MCANHLQTDCFSNLGQYKAGVVQRLFLNGGELPTLHGIPADERRVSIQIISCVSVDNGELLSDVLCVLPLRTR